ncbi:MAG: PfkB family carbohydrate kinase [Elainellaceae cyanobacterium]
MAQRGLFVGLVTLDFIYLIEQLPDRNQKIVALDYTLAAGGPATNAAIACSYLGQSVTLLGVLGCHPLSNLICTDLQQWGVTLIDLNSSHTEPPPTSSIFVTQATAERAVVSINARRSQASATALPDHILQDVGVVLIDGHQMAVGQAIAQAANAQQIPVVLDGGSWKAGLELVLPYVDFAICSANFYPPSCQTQTEVVAYLKSQGISDIAITQGDRPIQFCSQDTSGQVAVPTVQAVDTLGAGDMLHGAFCHYIQHLPFLEALKQATAVASQSCQWFGTRRWMSEAVLS